MSPPSSGMRSRPNSADKPATDERPRNDIVISELGPSPASKSRAARHGHCPWPAFDRAGIAAAIAEAHAARHAAAKESQVWRSGSSATRSTAAATARRKACLRRPPAALPAPASLGELEDELIRALLRFVGDLSYPAPAAKRRRLVVAAVGGYGRGDAGAGLRHRSTVSAARQARRLVREVAEAMLYLLWDLGQKVGHSTRSVDECLRQSRRDMTIRTALLEARFILGDETLFETCAGASRRRSSSAAARIRRRQTRRARRPHLRAGESRYLVEPNVKEGKGGLRDLQHAVLDRQIRLSRARGLEDLVDAGLFTPREYRLFCRCEEFLWRVRCHMHFVTGRPEEILSFDCSADRRAARLCTPAAFPASNAS